MGNVRGLRTRLCPECGDMTPHRTLYVKTGSDGRSRWFQLFWLCAKCASLNHIVLPMYRLEHGSVLPPTELAAAVVSTLEADSLDLDELRTRVRKRHIPGVRHVFDSDLVMVLEFLKGRGVIAQEMRDRTAMVLGILTSSASESARLGLCPAKHGSESETKALVRVYAQKWNASTQGNRLVPVGVLCPDCQYHQIAA